MKRNPLLFVILLLTLIGDVFLYKGVEILLYKFPNYYKILWYALYIIVSLWIVLYLFRLYWTRKHYKSTFLNVYATSISAYFIAKILFAVFTLIAYYRLNSGASAFEASIWVLVGLIAGSIPLVFMLYGILFGTKRLKIQKIPLKLQYNFDRKVKIIQISDWHLGSYFKIGQVEKAVEFINEIQPDLVVFTGDLVNFDSSETQGFEKLLSEIKAKEGVLAILGNHDYGMYKTDWLTNKDREDDIENLKLFYQLIGWDLLLNEKRTIRMANVDFEIIGIENWGVDFHQAGSLEGIDLSMIKSKPTILLSHDPTFWDEKVIGQHLHIDLTLSGHTHGFQLGIEYKNFKWSPAKYKYKRWAGLYNQGSQYLYVNCGLGYLGYPGRLGVAPEITLFEISGQ